MVLVQSIVNECFKLYESIPKTGKPKANEWTVISAMVGVFNEIDIKVISLATGSKCLGHSLMSSKGDVLNDSHAEVLTRRAFLKYLYTEIIKLNEENSSEIFWHKPDDKISVYLKNFVKFYFITSTTPCGDASIMPKEVNSDEEFYGECLDYEKCANEKNILKREHSPENFSFKKIKATSPNSDSIVKDIHRTGAKCLPNSTIQDPHLPGVLYHIVGAVRTKPGRGIPTLSLSCSDKIARWNSIGWQGALLSLFIKNPIFVDGFIIGGGTAFCKEAFDRAINERVEKSSYTPCHQSDRVFPGIKTQGKKPSPASIIWCIVDGLKSEVCVNGRKQGVTKKNLNKKSARSSVCKKELLILFEKVVNTLNNSEEFVKEITGDSNVTSLKDITYGDLKSKAEEYRRHWNVVKDNYFKVWTNKPAELLNFTLKEESI